MNLFSSFEHAGVSFGKKLLVALGYGLLLLSVYYLSVYFFDYPYATQPLHTYEYIIRQAYGEEVVYRLFPLMVVISVFGVNWFVLTPVIAGVSVYFALTHLGWLSVLPVGVSAVALSLAFLQFGGYNKEYLQGLLWAGFIHSFANSFILVFIPIIFFG